MRGLRRRLRIIDLFALDSLSLLGAHQEKWVPWDYKAARERLCAKIHFLGPLWSKRRAPLGAQGQWPPLHPAKAKSKVVSMLSKAARVGFVVERTQKINWPFGDCTLSLRFSAPLHDVWYWLLYVTHVFSSFLYLEMSEEILYKSLCALALYLSLHLDLSILRFSFALNPTFWSSFKCNYTNY